MVINGSNNNVKIEPKDKLKGFPSENYDGEEDSSPATTTTTTNTTTPFSLHSLKSGHQSNNHKPISSPIVKIVTSTVSPAHPYHEQVGFCESGWTYISVPYSPYCILPAKPNGGISDALSLCLALPSLLLPYLAAQQQQRIKTNVERPTEIPPTPKTLGLPVICPCKS